ncbi:hypothetical protein [Streptomyces mangrovisoli]|uniref:DUF1963 domain-containing protein n=1 Tax=Streptomyces mangrovisoli TaxID=1428628 RepID=A0A1J4P4S2_9ACTN|nr:hypothetical protein [Streptomyces mangrovisoli]OIJ69777.1 hypothetical protein WN71_000910 [Streptomyces mangrovisoli]
MVFVRTTPPRPVDVSAVFPELAPWARPAMRLHPRPGSPSAEESSVGGPLLWPAAEPWPHCEASHLHGDSRFRQSPDDVRLTRRVRARRHSDHSGRGGMTPEEEAVKERNAARLAERLDAGPPFPADCPVPMVPVAQLYLRDIPLLRPPGRADLLQVLWCPYDHHPDGKPATALFWRSAAEVVDLLAAPPEPYEVNSPGYVPEPCVLAPEAITEYPNSLDLSPQMRLMVGGWSRWQAAGADLDSSYADYPQEFYDVHLAKAPGWKFGGWPPWGRTDPYRRYCTVCEVQMVPLLTIASFEWSGRAGRSWTPHEDRAAADDAGGHCCGQRPSQPTKVEVGSTDNMQIYVCPTSPDHPHTDLIQ